MKVREYMKRKVRNHLENPPSICGCRRSSIINNIRLGLIETLKEDKEDDNDN